MSTEVEMPRGRSWRGIRQSVNPRTMTAKGRARLGWTIARTACLLVMVGGLAGAGVYLWSGFERPSETLAPVVRSEPLREVVLLTDGVLTKSWVLDRLGLPEGIALMAVDLERARLALESEGQVRNAVVSRDFPATLVVTLEERVPVLRALVPAENARREALFVARDGTIYRGFNYDAAMVASLPWVDGVRLSRRGSGFLPLEGIDRVSELLLAAQADAPHLAATFRVVSLAESPRLVVRTEAVRELVFEAGNHRRQLARLDYILDHFARSGTPAGGLARIDLSIPSQVAVRLAPAGGDVLSTSSFTRSLPNASSQRGL